MKTSGSGGYIITSCRTISIGSGDLEGKKQPRTLKKLLSAADEWRGETVVLCYCPDTYFPLDAYFPRNPREEACPDYCRIEAAHFLDRPEEYLYDHLPYTGSSVEEHLEKHLVLFYPAEPFKTLASRFAERHTLQFCGSPLLPEVHRSRTARQKTAFLDLGRNHVLLTVAENGRLEYFSCHSVKNRKEAEYFAIHELQNNPACREHEVQVSGTLADRSMRGLLEKETSCRIVLPSIPEGVEFASRGGSACRSSAASRAINAALMTLDS